MPEQVFVPKEIDDDLVEAYKARAIQDKVWGFMMSQTLWPTKRNLSAGRVQFYIRRNR